MDKEQEYIKKLMKEWKEMKDATGFNNQGAKYLSLRDGLKNFIKVVLKDDLRMKEIISLQDLPFYNIPKGMAPENKRARTKLAWEHLKRHQANLYLILSSIWTELGIKKEFGEKLVKVDKLDKKIKNAKKESERRSHVVDSKVLGAIIELLDIQRTELKKRDEINKKLDAILQKMDSEKSD